MYYSQRKKNYFLQKFIYLLFAVLKNISSGMNCSEIEKKKRKKKKRKDRQTLKQ